MCRSGRAGSGQLKILGVGLGAGAAGAGVVTGVGAGVSLAALQAAARTTSEPSTARRREPRVMRGTLLCNAGEAGKGPDILDDEAGARGPPLSRLSACRCRWGSPRKATPMAPSHHLQPSIGTAEAPRARGATSAANSSFASEEQRSARGCIGALCGGAGGGT